MSGTTSKKEENQMKIGWIGQEELDMFQSLLLPEVAAALKKGEPFSALGLTCGGIACGAAAAWLAGEVLEIRSFYVAPDYRRRGGGRLLLEAFLEIASRRGVEVEFSYTGTRQEHDTLPPFLTTLGFSRIDDFGETIYSLTMRELAESSFFKGTKAEGKGAVSFEQLSPRALESAYKKEAAVGMDYLEGGLTRPDVDRQTSVAILNGREIRSFLVVTSSAPDSLSLAWVKSGDSRDLPVLFRAAFARACKKYPSDARLTVQAVNSTAAALVAAVLPGAISISHTWVRESVAAAEQKEE